MVQVLNCSWSLFKNTHPADNRTHDPSLHNLASFLITYQAEDRSEKFFSLSSGTTVCSDDWGQIMNQHNFATRVSARATTMATGNFFPRSLIKKRPPKENHGLTFSSAVRYIRVFSAGTTIWTKSVSGIWDSTFFNPISVHNFAEV